MKFCGKCHRRVIKVVSKVSELGVRCKCDGLNPEVVEGSELMGCLRESLTHDKKTKYGKVIVKELNMDDRYRGIIN